MHPVPRRLIAAGLCAALQVGAWRAPLVHAHLDDHHDDHHDAAAIHAHFGGHGGEHHGMRRVETDPAYAVHDVASVGEPEPEQTTRLQIFVAVAAAASLTPALPPARFTLPPALESGSRRPPELVRSHGPPSLGRTGSRAPPAPSVLI